jgi:hypothetical protein
MNERIRELAEQAGFKTSWQHADVQAIKMTRFEKFAMLVIQDYENDLRESRREVKTELGYSRIGLGNV